MQVSGSWCLILSTGNGYPSNILVRIRALGECGRAADPRAIDLFPGSLWLTRRFE